MGEVPGLMSRLLRGGSGSGFFGGSGMSSWGDGEGDAVRRGVTGVGLAAARTVLNVGSSGPLVARPGLARGGSVLFPVAPVSMAPGLGSIEGAVVAVAAVPGAH
jgi:hypothetical protein